MVRICMFGGQGGTLTYSRYKVYITIFGGCEIKRGSIASQVVSMRSRSAFGGPPRVAFFVTLFGGTEIQWPTLVEEYLELMDVLRTGAIDLEEWSRVAAQIVSDEQFNIGTLTLFGSCDTSAAVGEDEELDRLALASQLGQIPETAREILMTGVGQHGSARINAVRQAAAATLGVAAYAER